MMTELVERLQPYMIALPEVAEDLLLGSPFEDVSCYDPLDPGDQRFFRLVTAGSAMTYGPMAMPLRMQLDCCTLPGAMFGFALPRSAVPPAVWTALVARFRELFGFQIGNPIEEYVGYVPVSEYCAVPSPDGTTVVDVSMFSLVPDLDLKLRSKAFALACLKAVRQVGVTQYDDPALGVHAAFGPLTIRAPRAVNHPHPERSFVYELAVPAPERLAEIARGGRPPATAQPEDAVLVPLDVETGGRVAGLLAERPGLRIVSPGRSEVGGSARLVLA